ncbi:hypothetical protein MAFF211471_44800 (plasmid) [Ralstonia solanacearum]|nr:hypothetical protein MAFF211471_44800 [Ralstonia solanacearum]BCN01953.1 hypothetical protein RPSA_44890 [Ralstonia solanacearum]BEU54201.1 hypothetical protein MAFF211520_44930 [Ralstonia pseudosolanacearum]BEU59452.1 hypothetical protein MAFF211521_45050 [Ralstonia pseudosolanacearum]BEU64607.1 hypothetical protein MAFF301524_44070 [Ralstonia pseudosolanacearum]
MAPAPADGKVGLAAPEMFVLMLTSYEVGWEMPARPWAGISEAKLRGMRIGQGTAKRKQHQRNGACAIETCN